MLDGVLTNLELHVTTSQLLVLGMSDRKSGSVDIPQPFCGISR